VSDTTRIYIASDFHAAEKAWRKFLNAIKLNVYKADVALVAGDFTGKAIVPIVETDGAYEADLFGVHRRAGSPEELATLERDIADVGYYSAVMSAADTERLSTDPAARDELLHGLMNDRMEKWMTLATERLADGGVPLFVIPGNDDDFGIDPILDREDFFPQNVDGRVLDMPGGLQILAYGWSNNTPWDTPREVSEDELFGPAYLIRRPLLEAIDSEEPVVLLIDEIDRADEEFEAFLLEVLSDFQITIPELGTIRARRRPAVILTSNRTRELHDALKRRALFHWIGHPSIEREIEIVKVRVPEAAERLAIEAAAFVRELRGLDLAKPPGVAETIDWTMALNALGRQEIDAEVVQQTLGSILKYREDIEAVRDETLAGLVEKARAAVPR